MRLAPLLGTSRDGHIVRLVVARDPGLLAVVDAIEAMHQRAGELAAESGRGAA